MNNKEYRIDDTMMTEQEFKNFVFGTGKVVSVKESSALISALKNGEYVIGVSYNPFCLLRAYHYANGERKNVCHKLDDDGDDALFVGQSTVWVDEQVDVVHFFRRLPMTCLRLRPSVRKLT